MLPTVNLLVEVFQFAAGVTKKELAFDPDCESEDVCEQQRAIGRDGPRIFVHDQAAPGSEKAQFAA